MNRSRDKGGAQRRAVLDSYHHPASESELIALVKMAAGEGRQLRVRGAAHSVSHAIYADPVASIPNTVSCQAPPKGDGIEVMLDRYRECHVLHEGRMLVEAEAGIHLGADPSDPAGTASAETSLLSQLWGWGWTLSNLGGITHQTVSGFTATGSSGGSVRYSVNDDLWGFCVIDARGKAEWFTCEDPDPSLFYAMSPNLGLLGVVSKVIVECVEAYDISGQEAISTIRGCAIDLFGPGDAGKPSLETFLRDAEYARVEWWPQRGAERVQVWQAQRIRRQPGFIPKTYRQFTAHPNAAEVAMSILLTVFGNLDNLPEARPKLDLALDRVESYIDELSVIKKLGTLGDLLARSFSVGVELGADAMLALLQPFAPCLKRQLPVLFPKLLGIFIQLDSDKPGLEKGEPQSFRDYAWTGLPMDNEADDELLRTAFTEIWVPITRTQCVMRMLKEYFDEPTDAHESYRRTGLDAWELYAAKPTRLWMSPSYTAGNDDWKHGAFRVDPFWFTGNRDDPVSTFYAPLWQRFRDKNIPFRLHWGKYQPPSDADHPEWVKFFEPLYPRWNDFLQLRKRRDPTNTFLTSYWGDRFGLWPG